MKTSEILKGDILFLFGKGFIKSSIEFITHGAYHTAIFIDSETLMESQSGRKSGTSPLSNYLNSGDKLEIWRDTTLTDQEREQIAKYALLHAGEEYDYTAIFEELLRYELHVNIDHYNEGNRRICSSFVNDCGNSVGKEWSKQHIPSPADLMYGNVLKKIGILET